MDDIDKINMLFRLITESPDNITINGTTYLYDKSGTVSCFIYPDGLYVVSLAKNIHHGNLVDDIFKSARQKEDVAIVHNFNKNYHDMLHDYAEARIWPTQKVFSMWSVYHPKYVDSVISAIKAINLDPTKFLFDTKDHALNNDDALTYEQFKNYELSTDEKFKFTEYEKRRAEDKKLAAQVKMGELPKSSRDTEHRRFIDRLMSDKFRKQPGEDIFRRFYKREGD
jgi:hypothetical protein